MLTWKKVVRYESLQTFTVLYLLDCQLCMAVQMRSVPNSDVKSVPNSDVRTKPALKRIICLSGSAKMPNLLIGQILSSLQQHKYSSL